MSGRRATSAIVGLAFSRPKGESSSTSSRNGSRSSSTATNGPSASGKSMKVRSSSPRSTRRSSWPSSGRLHERDVHVGERRGQATDRARQDLGADAVVGAHAQLAGAARRPRGEVRPRGGELVDDPPAVAQHDVAGGGQRDRARAARALHEPHADDPLEQRDLLADGRLRVAEGPGRAAERALAGDGVERREMTHLDAEPTIRISHRQQNYSELC